MLMAANEDAKALLVTALAACVKRIEKRVALLTPHSTGVDVHLRSADAGLWAEAQVWEFNRLEDLPFIDHLRRPSYLGPPNCRRAIPNLRHLRLCSVADSP